MKIDDNIIKDYQESQYAIDKKVMWFKLANITLPVYDISQNNVKTFRAAQLKEAEKSLNTKIWNEYIKTLIKNSPVVIKELLLNIPEFPIPIVDINFWNSLGSKTKYCQYADFFFYKIGLIVELDSYYHDPEQDARRDKYVLEKYGIITYRIRLANKENSVAFEKLKELFDYIIETTKFIKRYKPDGWILEDVNDIYIKQYRYKNEYWINLLNKYLVDGVIDLNKLNKEEIEYRNEISSKIWDSLLIRVCYELLKITPIIKP